MEIYICKTEDCSIAKGGAQFPAKMPCPVCGVDLVPLQEIQLDEEETRIIKEYPYLIAYPFHEMLDEKHPFIKLNLLKDVVLNVLKYMGLIVATEYFRSSSQSREINDLFRDKIYLPSFGSWNHFLRVAVEYLQKKDHSFFIPELIDFYQKVETGKKRKLYKTSIKYTDKFDNSVDKKTEGMPLIGLLINFRNKHLGHRTALRDEEAQKIFNEYYPFLKILLAEMVFCTDYQMIKYEDGHFFSLMGDTIQKIESNTKNVAEDERVWIQNPAGDKMPLIPFFIVPKEYITEISEDTELFIYDQFTTKRILFFSPERGEGLSEGKIVQKLQLLISNKSKQTPFTLQSLTEEKLKDQLSYVNKNISEGLINERKVLPGIYQERPDAEISLKSWVKGQASVYFLASEAGGGKTNLLNEMTRQYLESGFDTLLLRANRFSFDDFDKQLKHELNLAEDFAFEKHTCFQREQDNPFLILIDGLNECNNPLEFLSSIKEFQAKLKGGGIKIVISWRANTIKDLPELEDNWESFLYNAGDDEQEIENILAKKAYWLKRMNKLELEGAWENYTSQKQFKTKFTLQELTYKDRLLADQLSNPLLLRMFLELFQGKALTNLPTGALNLWELWYKDICKTEGADEILLSLTALMLEKEKSVLLLDTLYDHPVLSAFVRDIQINNPFQHLLKKGILSQYFIDNEIVVSFTMEALFHYCLGLSIRNIEKYNDVEELLKLTQTNRLPGIKEALKYILWNDILQNEYARINYFMGKGEEYLESTSLPLAQAFILYDIDEVLKNILGEYSDNEWRAIRSTIKELESAQEQFVKKELLIKIQKYINVNSIIECRIILDSLEYLELEIQLELLNKIIAYIATAENLGQYDKSILFNDIGVIFILKKDFEKSLEYHLKAMAIQEKVLGKEHFETSTSYNNIGHAYCEKGDYEKALEYHFKALEIIEQILGKEHPHTARSYNNIGSVYNFLGNYEKALEYHYKSLAIKEKVLGKEHPGIAYSYLNLGGVYDKKGDYGKALEYLHKSLEIRKKVLGKEHPETATSINNIGHTYSKKGDYGKAMEYYLKSLGTWKKVLGKEHPLTTTSYNNIGHLYSKKGDYGKALEYYFKSLAIREKVLGKEHPDTAVSYYNIGSVYNDLGNYEKALEYHLKALAIEEKVLGKEHLDTATSYNNIGLVYSKKGDYGKALENHFKALEIREKVLGKEHPLTAHSFINIGYIYRSKGDYGKALEYYHKSLEIKEKVLGKEHPDTAASYNNIGLVYSKKGDYGNALENHFKALEIREKVLGKEHPDTAKSYNNIGTVYTDKGDYEKALEYHLNALTIREKVLGKEHPATDNSYAKISTVYSNWRNYEKALEYHFKSLAIREKVLGKEHHDTAHSYNTIGILYFNEGDYEKALEYYLKSLAIREKVLGKEHPQTATTYSNIGFCYTRIGEYDNALIMLGKSLKIEEKIYGNDYPSVKQKITIIQRIRSSQKNTDDSVE